MSRLTTALTRLASAAALTAAAALLVAVPASAAPPAALHPAAANSATASYATISIAGPAHDVASPMTASVGPSRDVVGHGLIKCGAATGEVGYDPASQAGINGPLYIMIWFQFTKCTAQPEPGLPPGHPVPKTVVGSISFFHPHGNGCPLSGRLGTGVLNLSYNFPPVPSPVMIDPSAALKVTVTNFGPTPFWTLRGLVSEGSYKAPSTMPFTWVLKPDPIGGNCQKGITSEYIIRSNGPLTNI